MQFVRLNPRVHFELSDVLPANAVGIGREQWSVAQANDWYAAQDWLVGSNFIPSTAINQLEMWQTETFDVATIDRELGWKAALGMNTARVFLHDLLYEQDPQGFLDRIETYLLIANKHQVKTLFVLFDSCWDPYPQLGKQRDPKPHVHNSGWVQGPGYYALQDETQYPRLERYVKHVVAAFANDERVLGWDIWNEPDNENTASYGATECPNKLDYVLHLLPKAFEWARAAHPRQPLTSGLWIGEWASFADLTPIQQVQVSQSDIISFHNYEDEHEFAKRIQWLQQYGRPLLCTEYMARPSKSTFAQKLQVARQYKVGMYNWGFVDGKTQTKYPWDSWDRAYNDEPPLWFHDIFRNDGTPYNPEEVAIIKTLCSRHELEEA
ncbi:MAG: cellulase family glycosylhydrolase [Saprospiraceae bacterium]